MILSPIKLSVLAIVVTAACSSSGNTVDATASSSDAASTFDAASGADARAIDATPPDAAPHTASLGNSTFFFSQVFDDGVASTTSMITITNNGTAEATAIQPSIGGTNPDPIFAIDSTDCTATLAVGDSCNVIIAFGPTTQDTTVGTHTGELDIAYDASPATPATLAIPLNAEITGAATIHYTLASTDSFVSGVGAPDSPFVVDDDTDSASVTIEYSNSGRGDAMQFSINTPSVSPSWSVTTNNCDGVTLSANDGSTCDVTFTISDWQQDGETDLDLGLSVTASWVDGSGSNDDVAVTGFNVVYVVVAPPAFITITTSGFGDTSGDAVPYGEIHLVATLTGGVQVPDQTIETTDIEPQSNNFNAGTGSCVVNSATPTCEIDYLLNDSDPGSYIISVGNDGEVPISIAQVDVTIVAVKRLFVTATQSNGNLGGFAGANTKCTNDTNNPDDGATFKALLSGNSATTNGVVYANLEGDILGTAASGNLPTTLTNAISSASGIFTWTGAGGHSCSTWTSGAHGSIGDEGLSSATDGDWIDDHTQFCDQANVNLYCVEQ